MVEDALATPYFHDADRIMERLSPYALDEARRNDIYGETMVLNASFLIESARGAGITGCRRARC